MTIKTLSILGWVEQVSLLSLLLIAMPLKYLADQPQAVSVVGAVHGGLFLLFLLAVAIVGLRYRFPAPLYVRLFIGAVIPLGPLLYEKQLRQYRPAAV